MLDASLLRIRVSYLSRSITLAAGRILHLKEFLLYGSKSRHNVAASLRVVDTGKISAHLRFRLHPGCTEFLLVVQVVNYLLADTSIHFDLLFSYSTSWPLTSIGPSR